MQSGRESLDRFGAIEAFYATPPRCALRGGRLGNPIASNKLTHDAENMFLGVPIYIHWTSGAAKCSVKRCTVACYAAPSWARARAGCQVDGQRNRAIFAASNMPAPITMMLNRSYIGILNILLFL